MTARTFANGMSAGTSPTAANVASGVSQALPWSPTFITWRINAFGHLNPDAGYPAWLQGGGGGGGPVVPTTGQLWPRGNPS